jgi:hypothetical protein
MSTFTQVSIYDSRSSLTDLEMQVNNINVANDVI